MLSQFNEFITVGEKVWECKKYGLSLDEIKSNTENFFNGHKLSNITYNKIVNDVNEIDTSINIQERVTESSNNIACKIPSDKVLKHLKIR